MSPFNIFMVILGVVVFLVTLRAGRDVWRNYHR